MKLSLLLLVVPLLLLLVEGCGTSGPATGEVTGKVKLGDQLVRSGTVKFVDAQQKETSTAISPEGTYRVNRVAAGTAQVTLVSHPSNPFSRQPGGPAMEPPRTKTCEVRGGRQEQDLVFDP